LRNVALTSAWAGRLDQAVATSDEAVHFSGRLGDALVERNPRDSGRRAALLRSAGRLGEALTLLQDACAVLKHGGSDYWLAFCADQMALLHVDLGQPGRARDLLGQDVHSLPPEVAISRWITKSREARAGGNRPLAASSDALQAINDPACPARWMMLGMLESARDIDPERALVLCRHVDEQAQRHGHAGIGLHAVALAADRAAQSGDVASAGALASQALSLARQVWPVGMSVPEVMCCMHRGFSAANDVAGANEALERGVQWIELAALPNVPSEFRDSFLHRNPINRALLTAGNRRR
jgi:hypothetical protein